MKRALSKFSGLALVMAGLLFVGDIAFVSAQGTATLGQACGSNPPNAGASATAINSVSAQAQWLSESVSEYTCQNTSSYTPQQRSARCISELCAGASTIRCCAPPEDVVVPPPAPTTPAAAGDGCGVASDLTPGQRTSITNIVNGTSHTPASFTCTNVSELSTVQRFNNCVSGICDGENVSCCIPAVGTAPTVDAAEPDAPTDAGTTGQEGGVGRLALPSCISDGDCGLDDIVTMGVNFANFLFGISGAIFLLVFVVSGFRYIFFAWDAGAVKSAKDSLIKASIGMAIIALAGIATTFVYNNLRGGTDSGTESRGATCEEEVTGEPTGYTCQPITGIPSKDANYGDYTAALNSLGCRPSSRETTNLCTGRTYCCRPGVSPVYPAQE